MYDASMESESKQAKGGRARAAALNPEDRREIARIAAEARWARAEGVNAFLPKETHAGALRIGEREIPCSVLDNGVRVFSTRGIHRALGSKTKGGRGRDAQASAAEASGAPLLPTFLASPALKPFIPNDLMVPLISPLQYRPKHGGRTAFGYDAILLPRICEVILDADKQGALKPGKSGQNPLADMAGILIRAFARVGVIALVDEATGYQQDRARDELNRILEAYISKELLQWTRRFPDEFFKQVYRLHDWEYKEGSVKSPRYLGKIINRTVYEPMPPGVLDELRRVNPKTESGYRKYQHHRFLTPDTGHPHLDKQIVAVTTLMRVADSKDRFWELFERAFPKKGQQMRLEYGELVPLEIEA
ncbi:MAG: P63C domain-containing protein [Planctomycetota bacterium]